MGNRIEPDGANKKRGQGAGLAPQVESDRAEENGGQVTEETERTTNG